MKRKREDEYEIIKKIKIEHKTEWIKKRKNEMNDNLMNKKIFTEKDYYIKKLEKCLINLYKKYKESEYLLETERHKNEVYNKSIYVC
tara:strand:- start:705 stop:965 length:261 start_codon:yes stop_codon:yes gene_type:complete